MKTVEYENVKNRALKELEGEKDTEEEHKVGITNDRVCVPVMRMHIGAMHVC